MLSYQHIYHAGNFADVQKHALLVRLLQDLTAGPSPLHVLDTHAGRGFYDLAAREAQKTGEHAFGITPLWAARKKQRGVVAGYLDAVARHNNGAVLRRYPGSARLARDLLRPSDLLVAAERHPREFAELVDSFQDADESVTDLIHDDGLKGLTATPPGQGHRGLVIVDPSYELKDEYTAIPAALARAWGHWPDGILFLWYPVLAGGAHRALLQHLKAGPFGRTLVSEIHLSAPPKANFRMTGSGIVIANAPWSEEELHGMTDEIAAALSAGTGPIQAQCLTLSG